jgi:hypothetical protein
MIDPVERHVARAARDLVRLASVQVGEACKMVLQLSRAAEGVPELAATSLHGAVIARRTPVGSCEVVVADRRGQSPLAVATAQRQVVPVVHDTKRAIAGSDDGLPRRSDDSDRGSDPRQMTA